MWKMLPKRIRDKVYTSSMTATEYPFLSVSVWRIAEQSERARMTSATKGAITAVSACILWGILPIYWKALKHVPPAEILAHRVVWSLLFVLFLFSIQRRWKEGKRAIRVYPNLRIFFTTAFLLGANWLTFIWAINTNQIVEASLGYFINPLLNVCLGVIFLRERLYRKQMLAVGIALSGVLFLTWHHGRVPWIAFILALTFGVYGLLRKTAKAESMVGLLFEMGILTPVALVYLIYLALQKTGAFVTVDSQTDILLLAAGVITATPLLLFTYGARRIRYSTVGMLQYIGPFGHLLVGVLLYKEPFTPAHIVSFGAVWTGIIIYSISGIVVYDKERDPS
jgi:chloramphenicol-sensitive protein RarD